MGIVEENPIGVGRFDNTAGNYLLPGKQRK
jgi:hypothetical protein